MKALVRWRERWRTALEAAPSREQGISWVAQYAAMRVIVTVLRALPLDASLAFARLLGRMWWNWPRHYRRGMDNLRPALGDRCSDAELSLIGRRSCQHFLQLYLVEMTQTPMLVNEWTWPRYVRLVNLRAALRELLRPGPVIMVTPHFGNYELLGYAIARLGLPMTAVFRELDNPLLTDYLVRTRQAGGLRLLIKRGAMIEAPRALAEGQTVSFIADQDAGRKGVFADFFGRPASWYKSIALLAIQHRCPVIAGYAARRGDRFFYDFVVERIIHPEEWDAADDPVLWLTQAYAAAFEASIRRHPEQYLWVHRRWKTRPKGEAESSTAKNPSAASPDNRGESREAIA